MLAIQPLRTFDLPQHDTFSQNDIFVEVVYAGRSHHTDTVRNVNNPEFQPHEIMLFPIAPEDKEVMVMVRETDLHRNTTIKRFTLDVEELGTDFLQEYEDENLVYRAARVEALPEGTHLRLVETAVRLEESRDRVEELEEMDRKHRAQLERLTALIHTMENEKDELQKRLLNKEQSMRETYDNVIRILRETSL